MSLLSHQSTDLLVENIGGIDTAELTLYPGVTVLFGGNASNRSSLLSAVAGVLGARAPTLKTDAEEGAVVMEAGGENRRLTLEREGDQVVVERSPPTDSESNRDLFVRLLEDNPLRESVERVDEEMLYDLLMEPIDTADIESEIAAIQSERADIESTLERYDELESELPSLRTERSQLETELGDIRTEIDTIETELAELDDAETENDDAVSELEARRSEHRSVLDQIETRTHALEELESELEAVEEELDGLAGDRPTVDTESITADIDDVRAKKRQIDNTIQLLQSVAEANERALSGSPEELFGTGDGGHLTDELDPSAKTVDCWTCGSTVSPSVIEGETAELRSVIEQKQTERQQLTDELQTLIEQREEIETHEDRLAELRDRRQTIESEVSEHETVIDTLEGNRAQLESAIETLEGEVTADTDEEASAYVELTERRNDLEYERGQKERELRTVERDIEDIEETTADRDKLIEQLDSYSSQLDALRNRIYRIERETVETINETMDEVLAALDFDNIERVWVERKVDTQAGQSDQAAGFVPHIVRTTVDGAAYEDTIDTLSTSEREVIGIVLAVAGFLVHDVGERVPVLLLDAIEALDANRIDSLLAYLSEHVEYLVATAHPEDRDAFQPGVRCLDIEETLVS